MSPASNQAWAAGDKKNTWLCLPDEPRQCQWHCSGRESNWLVCCTQKFLSFTSRQQFFWEKKKLQISIQKSRASQKVLEPRNNLQKTVLLIQKYVAFGNTCWRMNLQPQSSAEVPEGPISITKLPLILLPLKSKRDETSLVVQWLRIRLPVQGTQVRALVREDPTCRGATKPVCHNY